MYMFYVKQPLIPHPQGQTEAALHMGIKNSFNSHHELLTPPVLFNLY